VTKRLCEPHTTPNPTGATPLKHAFTDLLEWESSLTTGATVIVRWTNCNRAYRANGTISKINPKSILVELAEDVLNPQYTTPACGLLRISYPAGRKITVPSHASYKSTSGNCIEPVPVEQPASVRSSPDLSPTPATPLGDIEIPVEDDRLFIGVFPCGISYADRKVEEHGDYKRSLSFLIPVSNWSGSRVALRACEVASSPTPRRFKPAAVKTSKSLR
jgi:hypothetical protein